MKKELSYMIIEYTKKDEPYLDYICNKIEDISKQIVNFFEITNFEKKINVKIYDNLENFRNLVKTGKNLSKDEEVPSWICGIAFCQSVYTLTLSSYQKTYGHENDTIDDLAYLILHEFTHACFSMLTNNTKSYAWLNEGAATTISHQYDNKKYKLNASLEEMKYGGKDYNNYHTMFSYVLNKYGKEYILKLIKNKDFLEEETPKLYDELASYITENKNFKKVK